LSKLSNLVLVVTNILSPNIAASLTLPPVNTVPQSTVPADELNTYTLVQLNIAQVLSSYCNILDGMILVVQVRFT
jgi:hypothetical protein